VVFEVKNSILIFLGIFLLALMGCAPGAFAEPLLNPEHYTVSDITSVSSYSVTAPDGYYIYEIIVDPLPMGTNQTHTLYYGGTPFILTIGTAQNYLIYNVFDISLTYPNGTVQTKEVTVTRASIGQVIGIPTTYQTIIQPVFTEPEGK
jgi:hypothetical protein